MTVVNLFGAGRRSLAASRSGAKHAAEVVAIKIVELVQCGVETPGGVLSQDIDHLQTRQRGAELGEHSLAVLRSPA